MSEPNRQVHHVYPSRSSQVPASHLNADDSRRAHILSEVRIPEDFASLATHLKPEDCWCGPTVIEWREKPNGRLGWVIVKEGADIPVKED